MPEYGPVAAVLSPRRQAVKCPCHLVSERHRRRETPPGCCSKPHSFSRRREARSLATLLSSAGVLAVFLLLLDLEVTGQTLKLLSKVAICCHRKGVLPRLGVLLPSHHAAMSLHPPYVDNRKGDPSRVAAPSESRRKLATLVIIKLAEKSFTYCCYAASWGDQESDLRNLSSWGKEKAAFPVVHALKLWEENRSPAKARLAAASLLPKHHCEAWAESLPCCHEGPYDHHCCFMREDCWLGVITGHCCFARRQSLGVPLMLAANTLSHKLKAQAFLGCRTTTCLETIGAT